MFDGCDDGVLRLFFGVRGVGIARITGCADKALARWLEERMMMPRAVVDEDEYCKCEEVFCGKCNKKVGGEMEWFGQNGRDAWTFGNR